MGKGSYIKFDCNLGEGGWEIAVTISNIDVMLFSNNGVILQSEGGGGQKRPKNCGHTKCMAPILVSICNIHVYIGQKSTSASVQKL